MRAWLPLAASFAMLAACDGEKAGEPIMRTEIGSGTELPMSQTSQAERTVRSERGDCRDVVFEGVSLTHCIADPNRHNIAMTLASEGGEPYRNLATYAGSRGATAAPIAFAMNGGMYDDAGKPIGYYVENGVRKQELSRSDGSGNFHLKPNGVFFGSNGSWQVMSTERFYAEVSDRPQFGTQSGPMLVIDGAVHPEITQDGPSKKFRNAVGVGQDGRAHFVIANAPLSFGILARYYRDELKTPNALFLDGTVSALWSPPTDRLDTGYPIGPIIAVTTKQADGE